MKKLLALFLSLALCAGFCACSKNEPVSSPSALVLAQSITDELLLYYQSHLPTTWMEVAAFAALGNDADENVDFSVLRKAPDKTVGSYASYLLSCYYLQKLTGEKARDSQEKLAWLHEAFDSPDTISTEDLVLMMFAFCCWENDTVQEKPMAELLKRQKSASGAFTRFPVSSGDAAAIDPDTTAWALFAITLFYRESLSNAHDSVIRYYLDDDIYAINDDNTLSDLTGKPNSYTTAISLAGLLSAGIPLDGEVSTALLTALRKFSLPEDSDSMDSTAFKGYRIYTADTEASASATAAVFFAAVCIQKGPLLDHITQKGT